MIAAAILLSATATDPVAGIWEGTSVCQVKPSPCHDEQVVYRFRSVKPRHYRVDAYKRVGSEQAFMGSMDLVLDPERVQLDGPVVSGGQSRGRLHLNLKGAHMSGKMTLADGTLYRLIEVDKH